MLQNMLTWWPAQAAQYLICVLVLIPSDFPLILLRVSSVFFSSNFLQIFSGFSFECWRIFFGFSLDLRWLFLGFPQYFRRIYFGFPFDFHWISEFAPNVAMQWKGQANHQHMQGCYDLLHRKRSAKQYWKCSFVNSSSMKQDQQRIQCRHSIA